MPLPIDRSFVRSFVGSGRLFVHDRSIDAVIGGAVSGFLWLLLSACFRRPNCMLLLLDRRRAAHTFLPLIRQPFCCRLHPRYGGAQGSLRKMSHPLLDGDQVPTLTELQRTCWPQYSISNPFRAAEMTISFSSLAFISILINSSPQLSLRRFDYCCDHPHRPTMCVECHLQLCLQGACWCFCAKVVCLTLPTFQLMNLLSPLLSCTEMA